MSKKSGLGNRLYVAGYDISGDVGAVSNIATPRGVQENTGINKSATERLLLKVDAALDFDTWFNDATGELHDALSGLPTADVLAIFAQGTTRGDVGFGLTAKQLNYDWSRAEDGGLAGSTNLQQSGGERPIWGEMIAVKETLASAGSLTGHIDVGAAQTNSGVVAHLHIFAKGSGTPTVLLEDSSDTTDGDDGSWDTIGTFTIQTARTAERLTVAGDVEKALRIRVTGTFTNLVVACLIRRGLSVDD